MKFYLVDVFAENKYEGNQLAVLVPDGDMQTETMVRIAHEIGFSETTFIMSGKRENGGFDVRIFTPDVEVPFAGHPTLGTAYIIDKMLDAKGSGKVILNLEVGEIPVTIDGGVLTMEQKEPEFGLIADDHKRVSDMLKINAEDISGSYPVQVVSTGLPCLVVPLKTIDAVERCAVNHELFQDFIDNTYKCNLLIFCAEPESSNALRVRVFVDDEGFAEDAATGSANGNLAGYLLKYNYFGKSEIEYNVNQGQQIRRPSLLKISAELTVGAYKIRVGGKVHLIAEGEWH